MARAQRTAELLAAAGLAPYELDLERQRTARENARTAALASLVPDLIQTGAGIAGDVAAYDLDKQRIDARNKATDAKLKIEEADALDRIANRQAKSAADLAKAQAEREKLERENVEKNRTRLESDTLERTRSSLDRGLSREDLEREAMALGVTPEVLLARADTANVEADRTRRGAEAKIKADERRANPPPKPGPSAEAIERQRQKDKLLALQIAAAEGKPAAAAAKEERDAAKLSPTQAEDVANIAASRKALARISAEARRVDPNVFAGLKNRALSAVGIDDDLTGYVAEARNFNSAVGAMRSGQAVGVAEQKRLDSFLVDPLVDTVGAVEAKRKAFEQYLDDKEAGLNAARRAQKLPEVEPIDDGDDESFGPAGTTSFKED